MIDDATVLRELEEVGKRFPDVSFFKAEVKPGSTGDGVVWITAVLHDRDPEWNFGSPEDRGLLDAIQEAARDRILPRAGEPDLSVYVLPQLVSEQEYLADLKRQDEEDARADRLKRIVRLRKELEEAEARLEEESRLAAGSRS